MFAESYAQVLENLTDYVSERLLGADSAADLDDRTPLLELGVLNSLETSRLVAYIRETFGVRLPPTAMTAANFRDLATIAGLVVSCRPDAAPAAAAGEGGLHV
jgi:acyl carrier protein